MKPFQFRLQRVLDVKKVLERQRERELAEALGRLTSEQQQLVAINDQLLKSQRAEGKRIRRTSREWLLYDHYITSKLAQIEEQLQTIQQITTIVTARRKRLADAFKEREILDRLKERYTDEYRHEMNKEDQAMIDELTSARFAGDVSPRGWAELEES